MTMIKDNPADEVTKAFWLTHPDPTQAAVHLALQWFAYVYPASELQIDRTLKAALPYSDNDLSSRWSQFLDENDVEEHVEALKWISETLSSEQVPFLVETCWRLLLVDHELPAHVPLALRIMGQVLRIDEERLHEIGDNVYREYTESDEGRNRAPLLPVDPRYLDRVEWRLYGHSSMQRRAEPRQSNHKERNLSSFYSFSWGAAFGAVAVVALVFGPLQLGRIKVPIMLHDGLLSGTEPVAAVNGPIIEPLVVDPEAPVLPEMPAEPIEVAIVELVDENTQVVELVDETPVVESTTVAKDIQSSQRVLMEVTASILNVRREATVDSEILIKLGGSARVWAYPDMSEGLWMLVKVEGEIGYASARFLAEVNTP